MQVESQCESILWFISCLCHKNGHLMKVYVVLVCRDWTTQFLNILRKR